MPSILLCLGKPASQGLVSIPTAGLTFLLAFSSASSLFGDEPAGAAIYRQRCARCHGAAGEGTKDEYTQALAGDKSLPALTRFIAKSMPKDAPGKLATRDAEFVADYVYDAFYSPTAQERRNPSRVELARLTVSEYRNAVADLVGTFREAKEVPVPAPAGLRGEYFNSTFRRKGPPLFARTDPEVRFDFGEKSPDFEKVKTGTFSASWQGSVLPADTGTYEFIVKTEHATRLWVNDLKKPLIDASIKSGNDTEFKGSVFLLGGRAYSLRLEFTRGTVGVRKEDKGPPPPVKTTIYLEWKPPTGPAEVIPSRCLTPLDASLVFAPSVPFPADDRSAGYERGTAVSKAWVQAITDGAIETASHVMDHLAELTGADGADRRTRLQDFATRLVERAFRRPLTAEQKRLFVDRVFESADEPETAVKRVVLLTLQSPRFLYREPAAQAVATGDAFDVASRLSFALWDSLPDAALLKAAAEGRLQTREEVAREAERLLADRRARAKLRGFFWQWLKLDQVAELTKDAKQFPGFDAAVVADLRASLDLFLEDTVWSKKSDFRELLVADHLYLNGRLSALYGGDLPADAPFQKVTPRPGERTGVLTHPFLLATLAYSSTSSPIHRGVFVARDVLGVALRQPPEAFTPLAPELHPDLTTRQRIALQTGPRSCRSCHGVINPIGYTLENFDAIGRYRSQENDRPVDPTGSYVTRAGEAVELTGARDLARFLAGSEEVHDAFVARLFHYLVRQPIRAFGPEKGAELRRQFADNQYDIRRLVVEILAQTATAERAKESRDRAARIP